MAWIRVDDHFNEHPKLAQVGPLGWGYWLAGLAYCNRNLTDGFIPEASARSFGVFDICSGERRYTLGITCGNFGDDVDAQMVVNLLVDAGLWDVVSGGYQIHDYLDYQPSKEKVLQERGFAAERMRKVRSGDVRANFAGSSKEVRSTPTPTPSKKEPKGSSLSEIDPVVVGLCERLASKMRERSPNTKLARPSSPKWLNDMRLLLKDQDGDVVLVERVLDWSQADSFWHLNILSPGKLREKFEQLRLRMEAEVRGPKVVALRPDDPRNNGVMAPAAAAAVEAKDLEAFRRGFRGLQ